MILKIPIPLLLYKEKKMSFFDFNKVFLIGRIGKSPEKQTNSNGTVFCHFPIAVNESYKDKNGQWQNKTNWLQIFAYNNNAEQCCKYLKKGSLAHVEGSINAYEKEKNNEKYTVYNIVAIQVKPLDYEKNSNKTKQITQTTQQETNSFNENQPKQTTSNPNDTFSIENQTEDTNESENTNENEAMQNAFRMDFPLNGI